MHSLSKTAAALVGLTTFISSASAGFNPSSSKNVAVYWGQNSLGRPTGQQFSQERLSTYCENSGIDIIPLAFMNQIKTPGVNFANAGDRCSTFPGTTLLNCPEIAADIQNCQSKGKTIILSLGGATYTEGGFSSASEATSAADRVWAMFGPVQSGSNVNRPFGNSVVDGFDFDFESVTQNMRPFAQRLRDLMDAASGRKFYLAAAPQCPYPDQADNDMLSGGVPFDFIMIQFYNNFCGVNSFVPGASSQNNFNLATWDDWARTVSANRNVKILIGAPGNVGGGGGYVSADRLGEIFAYARQFPSFGGVMFWDASQVYSNSGFLDQVVRALASGGGNTTPPPTTATGTTMTTSTRTETPPPPGPSTVPQWGQCGGSGYTGPTQCAPPFHCVVSSQWWASCQ